MYLMVIMLYILAAVVCGLLGRHTSFGFLGHFLLAIIITPIGDFLVQLVARPSKEIRRRIQDIDEN